MNKKSSITAQSSKTHNKSRVRKREILRFSLISNIIYWVFIGLLILVAGAATFSAMDIKNGMKIFTVQSGSMSPKIPIGSIVIIKPASSYKVGDIITFKSVKDLNEKNPKKTTTHRIVKIKFQKGKLQFITKGDANNAPDSQPVALKQILGKTVISLPLLGYLIGFANTQTGFIVLIVIPATIIIYSELLNIKKEIQKIINKSS